MFTLHLAGAWALAWVSDLLGTAKPVPVDGTGVPAVRTARDDVYLSVSRDFAVQVGK